MVVAVDFVSASLAEDRRFVIQLGHQCIWSTGVGDGVAGSCAGGYRLDAIRVCTSRCGEKGSVSLCVQLDD